VLSAFCDEMTRAVARVLCLGRNGCMFVTALTKSTRLAHLSDVAEFAYEPRQSPVFHINPKLLMGKRMDKFLGRVV